jgi:hypothetical protein
MKMRNSQRTNKTIWWGAIIGWAVLFFISTPQTALAQWTTNGNNISNTNSGNVGIGTTSPTYPLQVESAPNDGVYVQGYFKSNSSSAAYGGIGVDGANQSHVRFMLGGSLKWQWRVGAGTGVDDLRAYSWTLGSDVLTLKNNGNVGIGTTNPVFDSNTARYLTIDAGDAGGGNSIGSFGAGGNVGAGAVLGQYAFLNTGLSATDKRVATIVGLTNGATDSGRMDFYAKNAGSWNSPTMSINSSNVGIGTTSPVFDTNAGARYLTLDGGTGGPGEVGTGSNTSGTSNHVGQFSFLNTNLGGSDKRIALIAGFTDGATNSGRMDFYVKNAGNWNQPTMSINSSNINVTGNMNATGTITGGNIVAKYQDVAEWVPSSEKLAAGTVVVLDSTKSNQVTLSTQSYDTRVAGVITEQPGIALGEKSDNKVLVATTGRVRVKVDASRSAINIGDLLVTSEIPGVAMKSAPIEIGGRKMHMPGTLIGKALEPLAKGSGEILVLLSLQ